MAAALPFTVRRPGPPTTRGRLRLTATGVRILALAAVALAVVGLAGAWARRTLRAHVEQRITTEIQTVLATSVVGARQVLESAELLAAAVATGSDVETATDPAALGRLLAVRVGPARLTGYVVASASGLVIEASAGLARRGDTLPEHAFPGRAAAARGAPSAGLPFLDAQGRIRLLVVAAVPNTPWFVGLGVDHRRLAAPLLAGRAGRSGETYAFDRRGRLISGSRFPHHIRAAGLIGPDDEDTALHIDIRDPGGDLTAGFRPQLRRRDQPLTLAAAAAIAGRDGVSVQPYRDYRGVPVVGAWTWLADRSFGIACEVDAEEAFEPLRSLERVFWALMGLLALAAAAGVAGTSVAAAARLRAARAETQAQRLGEYVIERKLGAGAMGQVFLARHALLRRPTALKLLRPDVRESESLERFEREVRITASLTHPNTIAIYDFGRSDQGTFYYAMEYLEGIDLEQLVRRFGPLPDARVIHLLRQVCGSLSEAHEAGLVHRDVKPANLYLTRRGGIPDVIKVLDFGLVKASEDMELTRGSVVLGSPDFLAPELFESSNNASPRTDLYALGCTGYFLLTGHRPFAGSSLAQLCNAHLSQAPQPPSRRIGRPVDPALEQALLACVAKTPARRPRNAGELARLLDRSPLANAWSREQAEGFWAEHAASMRALEHGRADEPAPGRRSSAGP